MDAVKFNESVGIKIYDLRKQKAMSRVDLGNKVGLHETTVKKYEDGKIRSLGTNKLEEFAKALDTTVAFLMGWPEPQDVREETTCCDIERPEIKTLLALAQNARKEDVEKVIKIMEMFKR